MDLGILAYGGYLPRRRLPRKEIVETHAWFNPVQAGLATGERTIANWDEDSVTMAVEAARDCLAELDRQSVAGLYMASTTFPFLDRQNAGIVASALNLGSGIATLDISSSQRAGSSGLLCGLRASGGGNGPILVVAGEKRHTRAASPLELTTGDGAAALLVGQGDVIARFLGGHTETVDFVDHFHGENEAFDYTWEERWVRDEGYMKIVPGAIDALLMETGTDPSQITTFCFPAAAKRTASALAKALGFAESAVADNLQGQCGETGCAHPLVLLVLALERAAPGDKIMVAGFGQGCDALLFEVTEAISTVRERLGITGHLARRREDPRYSRFLALNGGLEMELGIRAEVDRQTGLSTHYRNKQMAQGMVGGRCTACGTPQFPKSNICVAPDCGATGTQEDEPFAEKRATLNSYTADQLTYTPDPPTYFGMVQFDGGGRLMCDFTDIDPDTAVEVGMPMRMVFRVRDYDRRRGFRRYFWKASPADGD